MNKFRTLLLKEYWIEKKQLLVPVWITLGYYLLALIGVLIAYFRSEGEISHVVRGIDFTDASVNAGISYIVNMAHVIFPGLLCILFTIILTQSALNEDIRRNFELFHRSQPVSIWLRSLAKYTVGIAGNLLVLLAIVLFNFIVSSIILLALGLYSPGPALAGMIQSYLGHIKLALIIGSICFFFSAVFKDKAFFNGIAILFGVNFLFLIFNVLFNWKLPLPLYYLYQLIKTGSMIMIGSDFDAANISDLIRDHWGVIVFNWKSLLQIISSGVLFAGATLIYRLREIK
ncbi:MAG: hypothetical protein JXB60_04670 [Candidatus Cloacimonetes bacterium]|nr:hypothetical protein [Candidatus Cloacimonadota bacterium]